MGIIEKIPETEPNATPWLVVIGAIFLAISGVMTAFLYDDLKIGGFYVAGAMGITGSIGAALFLLGLWLRR